MWAGRGEAARYAISVILKAVRRITGSTSSAKCSRYRVFVPSCSLQVGQRATREMTLEPIILYEMVRNTGKSVQF